VQIDGSPWRQATAWPLTCTASTRSSGTDFGSARGCATERGDKVSFQASDVFLPDLGELRATWADAAELEGTVLGFSDYGEAPRVFAVVEVFQRQSVVVPVAKLKWKSNRGDANMRGLKEPDRSS